MKAFAEDHTSPAPVAMAIGLTSIAAGSAVGHGGAAERQADPVAVRGPATVLLVDDDSMILETMAELLETEGYRVLPALDAEAALGYLAGATVDILVTDLSMPGSDGISLIRQGRSLRRDLPAILLTGYAEEANLVGGSAETLFHILRKPVEFNLLLERIRSLVTPPGLGSVGQ